MKSSLTVAVLLIIAASINTAMSQDLSPDLTDLLRKLGASSSKEAALAQDLDDGLDDDDDDDEAVAKAMTNVLLSSVMEDGDDGEDSIIANIMNNSNDEEASAQFRFFRRIFKRARRFVRSRTGRFLGRVIRRRVCGK